MVVKCLSYSVLEQDKTALVNTQEAMAPSRHTLKIDCYDLKLNQMLNITSSWSLISLYPFNAIAYIVLILFHCLHCSNPWPLLTL